MYVRLLCLYALILYHNTLRVTIVFLFLLFHSNQCIWNPNDRFIDGSRYVSRYVYFKHPGLQVLLLWNNEVITSLSPVKRALSVTLKGLNQVNWKTGPVDLIQVLMTWMTQASTPAALSMIAFSLKCLRKSETNKQTTPLLCLEGVLSIFAEGWQHQHPSSE